MQIRELLAIGEEILEKAGIENYKIDAEALLSHEIGYDKTKIFMNWIHEINFTHSERYFDTVNLRATGMPLQYIIGIQYFMGHKFKVNESVLIPRQETEILVEKAIETINDQKNVKTVLDMCTGSGAIAVSLAIKFPSIKFTGIDISEEALKVASKNGSTMVSGNNITFEQGDLFASIKSGRFGKKYDLITANPPYIKTSVLPNLQREIYDHEPLLALDGGMDGLDFYKKIIIDSIPFYKPNGCLIMEIGHDQAGPVRDLLEKANYKKIETIKDLSGKDRIIRAFR